MTSEGLFGIIKRILAHKLRVSLIINFDGLGGFKIKMESGDEATTTIFQKYIN